MKVPTQYHVFNIHDNLVTNARLYRGVARENGFITNREGIYEAAVRGPNLSPDLSSGFPQQPSHWPSNNPKPRQGSYYTPDGDVEENRPSPRNTYTPTPTKPR